MESLSKTLRISQQKQALNQETANFDEDHYYAMSIASRLRSLERMQKALARNAIEKLFLDIELGYYSNPLMQQNFPSHTPKTPANHYWQNQVLRFNNTPTSPMNHQPFNSGTSGD